EQHRKYLRSVRLFVHQLSAMPPEAQALAFQERQEELESIASNLRKVSRRAWKQPASFAMTMIGAGWTATTRDLLGAVLAGAGGVLGLAGSEPAQTGAYSYVFSARSKYAY